MLLLTKYLLLTDSELELWENDPDLFVNDELRGIWQENVQV